LQFVCNHLFPIALLRGNSTAIRIRHHCVRREDGRAFQLACLDAASVANLGFDKLR